MKNDGAIEAVKAEIRAERRKHPVAPEYEALIVFMENLSDFEDLGLHASASLRSQSRHERRGTRPAAPRGWQADAATRRHLVPGAAHTPRRVVRLARDGAAAS